MAKHTHIQTKAEVLKRVEAAKEELEKIPSPHVKGHLQGFMTFVREQGVVGLAVGLVLGTQVKTLVDQIVVSFINPLLGLVLPGGGNLTDKTFSLSLLGKTARFGYGAFIAVLISFLTVAGVVYFVVKGLKLDRIDKKKE
jgi:large conductance mechanosensitive channel